MSPVETLCRDLCSSRDAIARAELLEKLTEMLQVHTLHRLLLPSTTYSVPMASHKSRETKGHSRQRRPAPD